MRKPRLFRWHSAENLSGLLMVAQKIEESLFDYSVDTYKAPALNTHTRCLELSRSISHVSSRQLSEKSLGSIIEELALSIAQDPAAIALLGALSSDYKNFDWWSAGDIRELKSQNDLLKGRLRNGAYELELINQIKARLQDGHKREDLLNLTNSLIVEWMSKGYSRGFIFMMTRASFFSPSSDPIIDLSSFDSFVKRFQGKEKKHEVVLCMSESSFMLSKLMPDDAVAITREPPPPRFDNAKERTYLAEARDGVFVKFLNIVALDPRSAHDEALRRLDVAARLIAFHAHKDRLVAVGDALVYSEDAVTLLKQSPLAVHKEGDRDRNDVPDACVQTIMRFFPPKGTKESWARILAALGLHASAVSVKDTSVQLTAMWSALEALLPIGADQIKINLVVDYVTPILCRRYPMRLLAQAEADLKSCCPEAFQEVCGKLPEGTPEHLMCASIVAIPENEPLRRELYQALENNPLLQNRLYQLKVSTDSAERIRGLIERHKTKVKWHIRRVYRSRNLITHAGRSLPFAAALVENLHSYFHRVVEALEECMADPRGAPNIDAALLTCQLDHERHMDFLKDNSKKATQYENIVAFLAGPTFVSASLGAQKEQRANDQASDV